MKKISVAKDITLLCRKAQTFPEGVAEAFQFLERAEPELRINTFYGLSRGNDKGGIDYWAAVEVKAEHQNKTEGLELKTLKAGTYASKIIEDFRSHIPASSVVIAKFLY